MCGEGAEAHGSGMQQNQARDTFRLHTPTHRDLRDLGIAVGVLVTTGVLAFAAGDRVLSDGGTAVSAAPAPTGCDPTWDHASGRADAIVESAAADAGLVTRGAWVSRDGLTWEHVDGRVVVVAHPRTARGELPVGCAGADATEGSRA